MMRDTHSQYHLNSQIPRLKKNEIGTASNVIKEYVLHFYFYTVYDNHLIIIFVNVLLADMVYSCRTCFRSYHVDCSNQLRDNFKMERESEEDLQMTKWQCPWCVYGRDRPISEDRTNLDRLHHCFNIIIEGNGFHQYILFDCSVFSRIWSKALIEIEREFGSDLQEKLNAKIYFKNFVFRDTDIQKIKKLVQRNQIKFIDQVHFLKKIYLTNFFLFRRWSLRWETFFIIIIVIMVEQSSRLRVSYFTKNLFWNLIWNSRIGSSNTKHSENVVWNECLYRMFFE